MRTVSFGSAERYLKLVYTVTGAPALKTFEGDAFEPDRIELSYEYAGGQSWRLEEVEVGGFPPGSWPS